MRLSLIITILSLHSFGLFAQQSNKNPHLKLVWQDEFNTGKGPDTTKWKYDIGNGQGGWGNNELQYYTNEASNARIENGKLIIEARKENKQGQKYTSARLLTQGKAKWTYGQFEIRAKLPKGMGTWPAIWMLGDNIIKDGWPLCGEIDIMEEVWKEPNVINWSAHSKMLNWPKGTQKTNKALVENVTDTFHVYRLDWTKAYLKFYVDDKLYYTVENDGRGIDYYPFTAPQFLILNLAIGGNMPGSVVDDSILPVKMEVDYVRVYQ
jgi:beta-glucanase (GH16 family)